MPADDWTHADREALAVKIRIVCEKQLDLRLTKHRASVIAAALLNDGWRRPQPRPSDVDDHPRCECGSRSVRSDITVCADCGRWQ